MQHDATGTTALQSRLDANYRLQRRVYDLTRKYYLLGRDQMLDALRPPSGGTILEIGCGTARNLARTAKRYPQAELFGVDLSQMMLDAALRSLDRDRLRGRVNLAHGDATSFDAQALFARRTFDRVFFSYSLSMIPDWRAALSHGASLVGPGGSLHVVDFGRLDGLPAPIAASLRWWLAQFHVTPRVGLEEELLRLASERHMTPTFEQPFNTYAALARLVQARG